MDSDFWLLIGAVAVSILIFLGAREFWCWYWKINQALETLVRIETHISHQVSGLVQIRDLLIEIRDQTKSSVQPAAPPQDSPGI